MTSLPVKASLTGEILSDADDIAVIAVLRPFGQGRITLRAPAGSTLNEIAALVLASPDCHISASDFQVHVGGAPVARENWHRVRPKPGATVTLQRRAGDPISAIFSAIAGIGKLLGASFFGKLLMTGLSIVGKLFLNKLFAPKPQEQLSKPKASFSIVGSRNQAAPWGPVPSILGTHRVTPFYGGLPWTEQVGEDQYLRLLFVLGYGPLDIGLIRIGETPISSFEDVDIETFQGYPGDPVPSLYPNQVIEEQLSVELTAAVGWQQRTTADNIAYISIDLVWPQGLYWIDAKGSGSRNEMGTSFIAQYAPAGSGAWVEFAAIFFTEKTPDIIRRTYGVAVAAGKYDVRVIRTAADYTGPNVVQDTFNWIAVRGFRSAPPIKFHAPLALIALRIRATSQLNGTLDTLNVNVGSRVKAWNGAAWVDDVQSRWPSDLSRHVLQGPANPKPVPDSRIDLVALQNWRAYCVANNFTFCMPRVERTSVYDVLLDVCAAGRAQPVFKDGKWSVIWDEQATAIVQMFTPRNSWNFEWQTDYEELPHALRVRFINEDKGYVEDERIVYDDGYNAGNATKFEGIEFPGVTTSEAAWKHGRYEFARRRLRPTTFSLMADFESLICTRGDRIRVQHDAMLVGLGSGRVKAIDLTLQTVTVDEVVTLTSGVAYMMRFRLSDGSFITRTVKPFTGGELNVIPLYGEEARTNLLLQSNALNVSGTNGWLPSSGAIAANGDVWQVSELATTGVKGLVSNTANRPVPVAGNIYSLSGVFEKGVGRRYLGFSMASAAGTVGAGIIFDFDTGTITDAQMGGGVTLVGARPIDLGGGRWWLMISLTGMSVAAIPFVRPAVAPTFAGGVFNTGATATFSFAGNVSNYVLAGKMQFELGGYATSYIPTTTAAAARAGVPVPLPSAGDLFTYGELDSDTAVYRVQEIDQQEDFAAKISFVDDAPEIYQADTGSIPAYDSGITAPVDPFDFPPTALTVRTGLYQETPDLFLAFAQLTWAVPRQGRIARTEAQIKTTGPWRDIASVPAPLTTYEIRGLDADFCTFRIRAIFVDGHPSRWIESEGVNLGNLRVPPGDVTDFRIATVGDISTLSWSAVTAAGLDHYEIRFVPIAAPVVSWNSATPLVPKVGLTSAQVPTMIGTYLIKAFLANGLSSVNAGICESSVLALANLNVVEALAESPAFSGVMDRVEVGLDGGLRLRSRNTWANWESFDTVISFDLGDGASDSFGMQPDGYYYFDEDLDLGAVYTSRVTAQLDAGGEDPYNTWGSWSSFDAVAQFDGTNPNDWRVDLEYRSTLSDPILNEWSDWKPFVVGDVSARALEFRLHLVGKSAGNVDIDYAIITPVVYGLIVTVDMPDRTIAMNDVAVPSGGLTVTFIDPMRHLDALVIDGQDMLTGDYKVVSAKASTGFTIRFYNAASTPVARSMDFVAKGYGKLLN